MDVLHLSYAVVGLVGVALALTSRPIRDLPLSEPLVGLLTGVLVGPAVLGLVTVSEPTRDLLLLEGSRLLLAWSVMAVALRFPASDLRATLRPVVLLILVVMPVAAALTGVSALTLGIPVALAALVGACLAPTDPVLAAAVVTGEPAERDLPARVRQVLSSESGANDGLGFSLVGVALAVVLPATAVADAVGHLTWEILGGTAVGLGMGLLGGRVLEAATRHRDLDRGPELVYTLLLAVAVLGVARVVATDGVLAVFVAGVAYNAVVSGSEREPQAGIDEAVNRFAVLPLFVLLGVVLPWSGWADLGPGALLFVLGLLLLRRPVAVLLLGRPLGLRLPDAALAGWFGPMGVSALFYLGHSIHEGASDPRLFAAVTLAVTVSTVVFGVSAAPLRTAYAANVAEVTRRSGD